MVGRERQSLKLFDEFMHYLVGLQQQGEIESFEPVMFEPYGGSPEGFMLIRGGREKLDTTRRSEDFSRLVIRGTLIMQDLAITGADVGDGVTRFFAEYMRQLESLA